MAVYKNEYQNIIKIDGAAEIEKLRSALEAERDESDRLRSSLEEARDNVTRLYQELDSLKEANGVDILEQKIAKFEETASRATDEFKVFLQSVNLKSAQDWSEDDQFSRFYRRIKDGSLTSQEAILQVKTRFRELMEENYSSNGGLFDSQQVQSFTATLNRLSETVDAVVTKLQQIETEGVKTSGAIGGGGTGNILEVLKQIEEMSDRLSKSGKESIDTIQRLVQSISEYGGLDSAKLIGVSQAFKNIADIGEGSYSKAAVENIVYLTKQLAAINSQSSTSFRFDLTGLKDLKVSKAALSNLAEFLPKIPETGVSVLKKLSEIDFTNLQNLKVSKASVENLSKLADAERMGQVLEQIQQISKMMTASASQSGVAVTGEATKVDSSTAAYEKHAAAVEAAVQAENQKKAASAGVSQGLTEETYNTDQATESARAHANALRSVIDTLTNVNARMYALRNNGGEGTDEYAALERIRDRLEKLRENANSFSAKHITDAMAGIRLAFSEAKLDIGLFDNAAKDSAKSSSAAFADAKAAVQEYYKVLTSFGKDSSAQNAITLGKNGFESSVPQYQALADALNRTKTAYDLVTASAAKENLSADQQIKLNELLTDSQQKYVLAMEEVARKRVAAEEKNVLRENAEAQAEAYSKATAAVEAYFRTLSTYDKNANAKADIQFADGVYSSQSGIFAGLAETLNTVTAAYSKVTSEEERAKLSSENYAKVLDLIKSKENERSLALEASAAKEAARNEEAKKAEAQAEAYSKASESIRTYYSLLNELSKNSLAKSDIKKTDTGFQSSSGAYANLAAQLNEAERSMNSFTSAEQMAKMAEEDQLRLIKQLDDAQNKYALSVEDLAAKESQRAASEATTDTYRKLLELYRELSSVQIKELSLSPVANANELANVEATIVRINKEINSLKDSEAWKNATPDMTSGLVNAMLDSENKVAMAKAKLLDEVDGLARGLQQGKEKIRFDDLVSKFSALESASVPLSNAMRQLKDAQQVLTSGSATDSEKIDAYRQYADAIRTVTELIGQESAAQQRKIAQDNQLKQLTEEISAAEEKYAKGFSRASKDRNAAYNQLTSDVEKLKGEWDKLSPEEREARLRSLTDAWKELNQASGQTNLTGVNNGLGYLQSRIERMLSLGAILMSTFNKMKQMIKDSIEIDTAMTQLRIVTNSTASEYAEYGSTIAKTSKEIGASITDMIDSTTTFARLGYTLPDASELARVSAMISNVGAIDVSATQSALTAITKAFGINADEIESVMDKLVVVGNNFPVSVAELAEGMNNAGSALAAAGNSFEQSIALLTAANTTVQDISKASTGLRTITARIRSTKTELDELGEAVETSKYEQVINTLTQHNVLLTTANGEYRTTYDILKDIAAQWKNLTSMEQAAIAEQLAGNRQQNVFYSIIQQFQEAEGAMQAMENSSGALQGSYNKYLDSTQAKLNQMKATYQELSTSIFDSNMMGGAADILRTIFDLFAKILVVLDNMGLVLPGIAVIASGLVGPFVVSGLSKIFTGLVSFNPILAAIGGGLALIISLIGVIKRNADDARMAAQNAGQAFTSSFKSSPSDMDQTISRIEELKTSIDSGELSSKDLYAAQKELLGIQDTLSEKYDIQAGKLDLLGSSAADAAKEIRGLEAAQQSQAGSEYLTKHDSDIKKAIKAMEEERYYFDESFSVPIMHSYESDTINELYSRLSEIAAKYDEVSISAHEAGDTIDSFSLSVYGNARDADNAINLFATDFRKLKDEYQKKGINIDDYFSSLRGWDFDTLFESSIKEADKVIEKWGEIYDSANLAKIASNDTYADLFNQYSDAQKAFNDAMNGGFKTEEERTEAIANALGKVQDAWTAIVNTNFGDDKAVKDYIVGLMSKLQTEVQEEEKKNDLRLKMGIQFVPDDGTSVTSLREILSGYLAEFADENGVFSWTDVLIAGQNAEYKESIGATIDDLDRLELAYVGIRGIMRSFGFEVEDLADMMSYLGIAVDTSVAGMDPMLKQISGISTELDKATGRVEEFNKALEGGEMDDLAKKYGDAYNKFQKDWEAGKTGSKTTSAALDLFFSPEQIEAAGYDVIALGEKLNSDMYRTIFSDEGEYGSNFANYLKDTYTDAMSGLYDITEYEDGSFDLAIADFEGLRKELGMDADVFYALIEAMGMYAPQAEIDAAKAEDLAKSLNLIGDGAPADNVERVKTAIAGLYQQGHKSSLEIKGFLDALADTGHIDLSSIEDLGGLITEVVAQQKELEEQGPTFKIESNVPEVTKQIEELRKAIMLLPSTIPLHFGVSGIPTAYGAPNVSGALGAFAGAIKGIFGNASGTRKSPGGPTLVNELGPEMISENGRAYIANGGKPAVVNLKPGAIVLNARETKNALRYGAKDTTGSAVSAFSKITDTVKVTIGRFNSNLNNEGKSQGSSGGGNGGGSSSSSSGSNWFEEQYAEHKHMVEMDQETEKEFLDWLDEAYKRAYEEQLFDLKEYRQHEEEVYKGRQEDFKDHLSDLEHLISLEENGKNDPTVIYNYYVQMMADIEKELEKAYAYGLDATNEYVQYLQNTWNKYQKEIKSQQDEANNAAKKQVKDLVDYRIKMLKQYLKNEIQTLKDRLSNLKEFYSKQKEMLQDERDEEKYIDEQAEKRKAVSDIQAELSQLENDNSAWAQKRRKKLQEELAKAQKTLDDFEKDHALKVAQDQLDAVYEAQEKDINAQVDALQEKLDDPKYLYEQALEDVRNNSVALYEEMIQFNDKYGTGIKETITEMWEEAYVSLKRYFDLYNEYYKGINLVNATGYVPDDNYNNIIVAKGGGYASGTSHATKGLHRIEELGAEYVFTSSNGNRYRMLGSGDKVLDADSTNFLYRFATAGRAILSRLIGGGGFGGLGLVGAGGGISEIRMGDIIIQGNADERTVSEIRRAQRDGINTILKEFNRLKK